MHFRVKNQSVGQECDNISFICLLEVMNAWVTAISRFLKKIVQIFFDSVRSISQSEDNNLNINLTPTTPYPSKIVHTHKTADLKTGGYCLRCGKEHWLGPGNCLHLCRDLMRQLEGAGTIELFSPPAESLNVLETALLFGESRGKMFGVMECLQDDGTTVILYAFSGQYNGVWLVDGWMPPLFELDDFLALTVDREHEIKRLGREIDRCTSHSDEWLAGRKKRRLLSRKLMEDIHDLYRLCNFRGETTTLEKAFYGRNSSNGIPTGTGDCCAPKLLNYAAKNGLRPLGIAEFFWGRENRAGGHSHGSFSSSCREKCQPILGFMLCGLEDR